MKQTRTAQVTSMMLLGLEDAANEIGVDVAPLLQRFHIDPELTHKPDGFISLESFMGFLEAAVLEYDCPHFGLIIARHRPKFGFGILAQFIKASPDIGTALENVHRHVQIMTHTRWDLRKQYGQATLVRIERQVFEQKHDQMQLLSIAQYYQLLRGLIGDNWRSTSVSFSFSAPRDKQQYKRFFQAPVYFNEEFTGITFPDSHLQQAIPTSDPELLKIIEQHIETLEQERGDSMCDKVSLIIRQLLDSGICSIEGVALKLHMHPKKLQRALKSENTNFKELLKKTRLEIAEFYLSQSDIELIQLSAILGYNAPSALTRSFKQAYGISPQQWRQSRQA